MTGTHWRTRGHGVGWFWWRNTYHRPLLGPRLCWAGVWLINRFWLAYWYSPDGERWERVC